MEGSGNALSPDVTTLAERYREAGYATGGFYAGPYLHEAFGLGQGFDTYEYCVPDAEGLFAAEDVEAWAGDPAAHRRSHHGVTNPGVVEASTAWLEAHAEEPFFLFVHLWDAHFDFVPPPAFARRFADSGYDGWVDDLHIYDRQLSASGVSSDMLGAADLFPEVSADGDLNDSAGSCIAGHLCAAGTAYARADCHGTGGATGWVAAAGLFQCLVRPRRSKNNSKIIID